jgi:hypothetical protein
MPDASRAKLMMEQGQDFTSMVEMTDSGDQITYNSAATLWSRADGREPIFAINGVLTGGVVTPTTNNDEVSGAAATVNLNGVANSATSADTSLAVTRGITTDTNIINSITLDAAGALIVVAGVDNTAFSAVRGDPGGPPYIAVDSIEIAQVKLTSITAGVVLESEIFQVPGLHCEHANFPLFTRDFAGGDIAFQQALPQSHTGDLPKRVYVEYYEPILQELTRSSDFVSAEDSHSVASTQVYNETIASTSSSLGQGGFTQLMEDGILDPVVSWKNQIMWFKFFQDRTKTAYELVQGKVGIARTWPAGDSISAACTISAESAGIQNAS